MSDCSLIFIMVIWKMSFVRTTPGHSRGHYWTVINGVKNKERKHIFMKFDVLLNVLM